MKVELNSTGELKVTAENSVEAYALKHWASIYFKDKGKGLATLTIVSRDINSKEKDS